MPSFTALAVIGPAGPIALALIGIVGGLALLGRGLGGYRRANLIADIAGGDRKSVV